MGEPKSDSTFEFKNKMLIDGMVDELMEKLAKKVRKGKLHKISPKMIGDDIFKKVAEKALEKIALERKNDFKEIVEQAKQRKHVDAPQKEIEKWRDELVGAGMNVQQQKLLEQLADCISQYRITDKRCGQYLQVNDKVYKELMNKKT